MSIIKKIEQDQIAKLKGDKKIPDFKAGDTVKVHVKIKDEWQSGSSGGSGRD